MEEWGRLRQYGMHCPRGEEGGGGRTEAMGHIPAASDAQPRPPPLPRAGDLQLAAALLLRGKPDGKGAVMERRRWRWKHCCRGVALAQWDDGSRPIWGAYAAASPERDLNLDHRPPACTVLQDPRSCCGSLLECRYAIGCVQSC